MVWNLLYSIYNKANSPVLNAWAELGRFLARMHYKNVYKKGKKNGSSEKNRGNGGTNSCAS
jgi:hypothetical protein